MSTAIHILRLKVGGWKAISESNPLEIDFRDSGIFGSSALIVGPNESGKSSLFSALRFALFEKFNRRGEATQNWVNTESDSATIEVDLLINGSSYTIIKTRKLTTGGTCNLYEGTGEDKTILLRGPDADTKILELLGASWKSSITQAETPSNWGLLAWLLAPQGMDSVNPARESGTESLGLSRVMSPELDSLKSTLEKSNATELNDNGTAKKHGKYWEAEEEEKTLSDSIKVLEFQSEEFSDLMEKIRNINSKIVDSERKMNDAQAEYDSVIGDHSDSEPVLGLNLDSLEEKVRILETQESDFSQDLDALTDLEEKLISAREEKTESIENEAKSSAKLDDLLLEQRIKDGDEKDIEDGLEKLRKGHRKIATRVTEIEQQIKRKELESELSDVDKLMTESDEILKAGTVLELGTLQDMKKLIDQYTNVQQRIDAKKDVSGLTVQSEGEFDGTIILDGEDHSSLESPQPFGISLDIKTKKGTTILVKSSTQDDDGTLLEERDKLRTNFGDYDVSNFNELCDKHETEQNRSSSYQSIKQSLALLRSKEDLQKDISQIDLIEFPEDELNDIEILITERDEMQDKLDEDAETLKNLRIDNNKNQREIGEFRTKHEQLRILRAGYETNVKNKDKQVRDEIQRKGGTEKREEKLTKVKKDLKKSNNELKATVDSLDQKSKSRRSNVKRAKTNRKRAESDYDEIKTKLTRMTYEAEKIGDDNIHEKLHELTTLHRDISQVLDRFRTQAFARRDLLKRIKLKISESTFSNTKPIREKVSDWLYAVTEGKWRRVEMGGNLEIIKIQGPQGKLLPGEHYGSHGLQQVIHGLIRLAVATHIYEKGKKHNPDFPPVSLVMDESQGHVDDNRVKLLMERFNTAIKDGQVQVIALSHRESEFRSLNPVIEYRVDKRLLFGIDEEE